MQSQRIRKSKEAVRRRWPARIQITFLIGFVIVLTIPTGCRRFSRRLPSAHQFATQLHEGAPGDFVRQSGLDSVSPQPKSFHQLPTVRFADRPALVWVEGMEPVSGQFASKQSAAKLRILTLKDTEILAAGNSEAASHIRDQREWLACKNGITKTLLESLKHQEEFERNRSAAQAIEAFFQLAEIDTLLPIIDQSIEILTKAEIAIQKVHNSGLAIEHDTNELQRQKIALRRQRSELVYNRKLLSGKLSLLLNLDPESDIPIWASFRPYPDVIDIDNKGQVQIAFQNRGDLLGIETLALARNPKSLDQLRQVSAGKSSVLGISPTPIGPARWWQRRLKAQLDCLLQKEFARRKTQLARLALSQKKLIRAEVSGLLLGIENRRQKVESIGKTIESLNKSIRAAEKAKDQVPVDFPEYLKWKLEVLKLTSDSVHQLVGIQIDQSKLKAAQGILGKKRPGVEEFAHSIVRE